MCRHIPGRRVTAAITVLMYYNMVTALTSTGPNTNKSDLIKTKKGVEEGKNRSRRAVPTACAGAGAGARLAGTTRRFNYTRTK